MKIFFFDEIWELSVPPLTATTILLMLQKGKYTYHTTDPYELSGPTFSEEKFLLFTYS